MEGLGDDETLKAVVSKTLGMPSASDAERTEQQVHPSLRTIWSLLLLSSGIHDGVTVERGGKMSEWAGGEGMEEEGAEEGREKKERREANTTWKKRSTLRAKNAQ